MVATQSAALKPDSAWQSCWPSNYDRRKRLKESRDALLWRMRSQQAVLFNHTQQDAPGEVVARLQRLAPCIAAQVVAAKSEYSSHSSRRLVSDNVHQLGVAAKHFFDKPIVEYSVQDVKHRQRGLRKPPPPPLVVGDAAEQQYSLGLNGDVITCTLLEKLLVASAVQPKGVCCQSCGLWCPISDNKCTEAVVTHQHSDVFGATMGSTATTKVAAFTGTGFVWNIHAGEFVPKPRPSLALRFDAVQKISKIVDDIRNRQRMQFGFTELVMLVLKRPEKAFPRLPMVVRMKRYSFRRKLGMDEVLKSVSHLENAILMPGAMMCDEAMPTFTDIEELLCSHREFGRRGDFVESVELLERVWQQCRSLRLAENRIRELLGPKLIKLTLDNASWNKQTDKDDPFRIEQGSASNTYPVPQFQDFLMKRYAFRTVHCSTCLFPNGSIWNCHRCRPDS